LEINTTYEFEADLFSLGPFFFKDFICQRERASTSRGIRRQREKQAPRLARSLRQDSIPGAWDHDLSQRQSPNGLSHPGVPSLGPFLFPFLLPPSLPWFLLMMEVIKNSE